MCPPQYLFGLAPGILPHTFQLMSLILAQQIILLITDKSRGCSSALLSPAEGGTQQENITPESELGNMAGHTQAAAATNLEETLFEIRAAGLVSHHWEIVPTAPVNTLQPVVAQDLGMASRELECTSLGSHNTHGINRQLQSILCARVGTSSIRTLLCCPSESPVSSRTGMSAHLHFGNRVPMGVRARSARGWSGSLLSTTASWAPMESSFWKHAMPGH